MVIETKDVFTVAGPTTKGRPFINEPQLGALSISSTFLADKRTLMNWIKRTPEAIGIVRQMANDVVTRIRFISMDKPKMGRPSKNKNMEGVEEAHDFARKNHLKQILRSAVFEQFALGNGYVWKGKIDSNTVKEIMRKELKKRGISTKGVAFDENVNTQLQINYVPSTTMDIQLNREGTGVDAYIQRTGYSFGNQSFPTSPTGIHSTMNDGGLHKTRKWSPEQIIHGKFMDIDGKVHGFTPMQSAFPIIKTLGLIKDYHGHFFDSGIFPDIIFNFEDMDANSVEFEKMQQVLQEWYDNRRRSHAVVSSKFKVEKLNEWNKDMEFRMLAIYYTGVIAFGMGMPLEKIRAILGGEIKSSAGGSDISNIDYQRNIFDIQDDWETLMNTQLFNEEFGVNMVFERAAARDEMAEVQRDEQKLNLLQKMDQMDMIKDDKKIHLAEKFFPDIPSTWWNENPQPQMEMGGMIPSSKALPKGPEQQALSDQKKKQQEPQAKNNPPTGR